MPAMTFMVDPWAPLVFRDGRPFGSNNGRVETLPFPLPSTIAGALRASFADSAGWDFETRSSDLLRIGCDGPLLCRIKDGVTTGGEALFPVPCDAEYLAAPAATDQKLWYRMRPRAMPAGDGCNLPEGMMPLFRSGGASKAPTHAPEFWTRRDFENWLCDDSADTVMLRGDEIPSLPVETRTHVSISRSTQTADDGMLFQTTGLDFNSPRLEHGGWKSDRYALLARLHGAQVKSFSTFRSVGGEARLAHIREVPAYPWWPSVDDRLCRALTGCRHLRLTLVTPALFRQGWRPGWLTLPNSGPSRGGVAARLRAAAIPRWQAFSGWQMRPKPGGPRAVRRLVPAGSVFWFELAEPAPDNLAERMWLQSVCDDEQDRKDGFGLAVPGVWTR